MFIYMFRKRKSIYRSLRHPKRCNSLRTNPVKCAHNELDARARTHARIIAHTHTYNSTTQLRSTVV